MLELRHQRECTGQLRAGVARADVFVTCLLIFTVLLTVSLMACVCVCVCVRACALRQVCVCACARSCAFGCCFVSANGLLVDVCQCCCLLMFVCLPLSGHFPCCKTW